MVEELLDYSKIQSGKISLSIKRVDVSELMAVTVLVFKEKAAKRGIKLIYHGQPGEMIVDGDPSRLKQVFVNIVDNAIKHSYDDSQIQVYSERIEGGYALTVADKGAGIKAEDLPYIKTRFYKGKSNVPGSGLGLAISDSVVTLHGGYLDIFSEEGKGTTVVVSLPERMPKASEKKSISHPAPPAEYSSSQKE
jgi:signal transduction histidine kinase